MRAALREGRDCEVLLRNYRKNGALFWNDLRLSPVHDDRGRIVNFVGVQNDVTKRRRAEEGLRRARTPSSTSASGSGPRGSPRRTRC